MFVEQLVNIRWSVALIYYHIVELCLRWGCVCTVWWTDVKSVEKSVGLFGVGGGVASKHWHTHTGCTIHEHEEGSISHIYERNGVYICDWIVWFITYLTGDHRNSSSRSRSRVHTIRFSHFSTSSLHRRSFISVFASYTCSTFRCDATVARMSLTHTNTEFLLKLNRWELLKINNLAVVTVVYAAAAAAACGSSCIKWNGTLFLSVCVWVSCASSRFSIRIESSFSSFSWILCTASSTERIGIRHEIWFAFSLDLLLLSIQIELSVIAR